MMMMVMMMMVLFEVGEEVWSWGRRSKSSVHPFSYQVKIMIILIIHDHHLSFINPTDRHYDNDYHDQSGLLANVDNHGRLAKHKIIIIFIIAILIIIIISHIMWKSSLWWSGRTACPTWTWPTHRTQAVENSTTSIFITMRKSTYIYYFTDKPDLLKQRHKFIDLP